VQRQAFSELAAQLINAAAVRGQPVSRAAVWATAWDVQPVAAAAASDALVADQPVAAAAAAAVAASARDAQVVLLLLLLLS
jgi:hypothetical protein